MTLQTARIFSHAGELLVWRDEAGEWAGRLSDEPGTTAEETEDFDEYQILLGTNIERRDRGFPLLSEGSQGLFHAVPLHLERKIDEQIRPLRLVVRHYLKEDKSGFLRVDASRLVDLHLESKESKESNA